ncbi:MAG: HD domain-containing protein [Xanthobacteraceae bacterium]|nr:HD domain-containing protein [Xanthobacteraceae bacterium]
MSVAPNPPSVRKRFLLASDRSDRSGELAQILRNLGDVGVVSTSDIPEAPTTKISGVVVDIDLRCPESVQRVRRKLTDKSYQSMPRLFVLADALHHGSMQAWALGATDTIERPFDARAILQRVRAAFPDTNDVDRSAGGQALNKGVAAAHLVLVKIFNRLPAGVPLVFDDVLQAETQILRAIRKTSLQAWLAVVGRHHNNSYRHCLFVTGFAVALAQSLGMREDDQRRLARAALLHDVGKAYIPVSILDKAGELTDAEADQLRQHPRLGYEALAEEGNFPPEVLDVVLHHHEFLDGSGYPHGLTADRISDIVRLTTIVDIYATLMENSGHGTPSSPAQAFAAMERMGGKLDQPLVQAFRPVAFGM